ncbi:hypothetical protein BC332_10906 [Capsicum chinense]|nr:hypothetical protein BC332_10906 [Capsicum chinense]
MESKETTSQPLGSDVMGALIARIDALGREMKSASDTLAQKVDLAEHLEKVQIDVVELQAHLTTVEEIKRAAQEEVEATNVKLKKLEFCLEETEVKCLGIQTQLEMVEILKSGVDVELKATNAKKYGL